MAPLCLLFLALVVFDTIWKLFDTLMFPRLCVFDSYSPSWCGYIKTLCPWLVYMLLAVYASVGPPVWYDDWTWAEL